MRSLEVDSQPQLTAPDDLLARLAARQHGVVARAQLIDAGLLNAGFSTIRITHKRLTRHAEREAERLRSLLL